MKKLEAVKDYIAVKFICDGNIIEINENDELQVVFPNGEMNFVKFKLIDRCVNDAPCRHEWKDAFVNLDYKGLELGVVLSVLMLNHKCDVYINK